jgi:hypothetical protein
MLPFRAYTVHREQDKLRKSLVKYNNFVKEKAAKVEEGERVFNEEREYQKTIKQLLEDKQNLVQDLQDAKTQVMRNLEVLYPNKTQSLQLKKSLNI